MGKILTTKNRLSRTLFPLALVYNFSFACLHLYFFETGRIPVIGVLDNPMLAWLSLVMMCAYSYAIPWRWLSEPKAILDQSSITTKKIEQLLHFLKITLVILVCAFFYSVMLVALASKIIPLDAIDDTNYAIGCALLYLFLVSVGVTLAKARNKAKI